MAINYYLLKVFYLGTNYHGIARQPGLNTIEGEIFKAFQKKNYFSDLDTSIHYPIHIASRTDKGVHARDAVLGVLTSKKRIVPMEINNILPNDIKIWGYSLISDEFRKDFLNVSVDETKVNPEGARYKIYNPRINASYRHYRYLYYNANFKLNQKKIVKAAKKLKGTHDFSNFCKNEPNRNTFRTINSIKIKKKDKFVIFDFIAKSFLWKQIRKTVDVLIKIGTNKWPIENLDILLNNKKSKIANKITPLSADGLILWKTEYPSFIHFEKCNKSVNQIEEILKKRTKYMLTRYTVFTEIENSF